MPRLGPAPGLVLMLLLGVPRAGRADFPLLDLHAQYEEQLIANTLAELGLERDPQPLGKKIERIIVAPHDIFQPKVDPVPMFLNYFHATTKPHVIEQELLFQVGDVIRPDTLEETARNLRGFFVLSTARIVTAKGSQPGYVVVVVVAKDIWSLRPNSNFQFPNGKLELLSFTLAEHNLAGRNKFLGLTLRWDPGTFLLGPRYTDPRLVGSRIALDGSAQVIFNRETGRLEGVAEFFSLSRPLYSLAQKWGWLASLGFEDTVARLYRDSAILLQPLPSGAATRYEYRRRIVGLSLDGTRSFGLHLKHNFTAGYHLSSQQYDPMDPANADEIRATFLPQSENITQLVLRYDFYEARYATLKNIGTFAFTEDYRIGPQASLEIDWASSLLGFSSDFIRFSPSVAWWFLLGRGHLLGLTTSADARYTGTVRNAFPSSWVNRSVSWNLSYITPHALGFRLLTRGLLQLRDYDLSRSPNSLGATTGLRGFPAGQFQGQDVMLVNLEARSLPIALLTVYLGGAVFYDGGMTFPSFSGPKTYHQDVGVGMRILFPQFNHQVIRVDIAFPLESTPGLPGVVMTAAFGQPF